MRKLKREITRLLGDRPLNYTFYIDTKTDEYLWRQASLYHLSISMIVALILNYAREKDFDIQEIFKELKGEIK